MTVKKMGRPTTNPKNEMMSVRLDDETKNILEQYMEKENISKTEAVRKGIGRLKSRLRKKRDNWRKRELMSDNLGIEFGVVTSDYKTIKFVGEKILKEFNIKLKTEFKIDVVSMLQNCIEKYLTEDVNFSESELEFLNKFSNDNKEAMLNLLLTRVVCLYDVYVQMYLDRLDNMNLKSDELWHIIKDVIIPTVGDKHIYENKSEEFHNIIDSEFNSYTIDCTWTVLELAPYFDKDNLTGDLESDMPHAIFNLIVKEIFTENLQEERIINDITSKYVYTGEWDKWI